MTAFDPDKITFFAKTDARGQEVAFGIKAKDRQRHMYVVGKTGMGKSTMLENMAAQDIQNGEGMAFIDPHGSAAETLLEYVPEHRVKDVVYFAPFDLDHPVSFNVMEDVGPDKRHLVVSGLMSTFKKIWVDAWSARMEYILTNALLALIEYPDTTLLSVNRLFVDKEYRKKVVDYIQDPAVKAFWVDEFANYTDRFTAEALPAIQNKIGQFTGNPLIRNIIGQPHSSFDIRKLMDEKKILIMNLSKGLIGETNANLLGSMLTTRIYLAAMSRADLPVAEMKKMPNFYFYVDEFQSFANATFANILSEARKYHLNLIIAHQYIEQMEEDVRNAVFGNVGTTIAFRVGPFDAEVLETVFAPRFEATDLVNLGFAQIYLTLMIDGIGSHPFSAKTLPPVQLPATSCREMVVNESRKYYAHKREEVEEVVAKLHTPERKPVVSKKPYDKKPNNNGNGQTNNYQNGKNNKPTPVASAKAAPANSSGQQKSQSTNGGEYPKSAAQNQKSPEDLRQILSKLSNQSNQAGASTKPVSNSISVTTKETTEEIKKPAQENIQKEAEKPFQKQPPKKFTEPRERMTTKETNNDKKNFKSPDRFSKNNQQFKQKQKPTEPSDLKSALADVLKKVNQPVEKSAPAPKTETTVQSPVETAPRSESEITEHKDPKQGFDSPARPAPAEFKSSVRKVVVEQRRKPEDRQTNTASQTAPQQSQLDIAKIRKMLNQGNSERSPFQ